MSSVTGEIGFKIGAAGAQLPGVNRPFNAQNGTALTVNGVIGTYAVVINSPPPTATAKSLGLEINAAEAATDSALIVNNLTTGTLMRLGGDGRGFLGWNNSGTSAINWNNTGLTYI